MQTDSTEQSVSEVYAISLGCIIGLLIGVILGRVIVVLLGDSLSGMWIIVMLHTMLAMMVMGGWTAPSLMPRNE